MTDIFIKIADDRIEAGSSPKLIIDLNNQNHVIDYHGKKIPYPAEIRLSPDLLRGRRSNVLQSAVMYYYQQAYRFAEDWEISQEYKKMKNL